MSKHERNRVADLSRHGTTAYKILKVVAVIAVICLAMKGLSPWAYQ